MHKSKKAVVRESVAKLMATENINVKHKQIHTAAFDIVKRDLILPIWKEDISDNLYNLLISHEVGHALYTEQVKYKETFVRPKGQKLTPRERRLHTVWNIIEDARIEKMIQKQFPGTRSCFINGYNELAERDIFKIEGKTQEQIKFLDKVNLHYKLEINGILDINFTPEEKGWLDRVDDCRTLEDTIILADEMLKYVEEQKEEEVKEYEYEIDESDSEGSDPTSCGSQDQYEKFVRSLVDPNAEEPVYVSLANPDLSKVITPFNVVQKDLQEHYSKHAVEFKEARDASQKFRMKTKPVVDHMVQIFEMKKKATEYARNKISKTGMLDMNRVHKFAYNDDIFKKVTTVIGGKNHGLLLFIDMSGSMTDNMQGTIEQLLCLTMFCRKINIPFSVYGFNDNRENFSGNHSSISAFQNALEGEILIKKGFELREYFSSNMTAMQFSIAIDHMIAVSLYYGQQNSRRTGFSLYNLGQQNSQEKEDSKTKTIPRTEHLNGTPLDETILCSIKMVDLFRSKYKLDIVNAIFLTDGDSTSHLCYRNDNKVEDLNLRKKVYIRNERTRRTYLLDREDDYSRGYITRNFLNILREVCGIKVIGFFINSNLTDIRSDNFDELIIRNTGSKPNIGLSIEDKRVATEKKKKSLLNYFQEHGFVEVIEEGYDAYYIMQGGRNLTSVEKEFKVKTDPIAQKAEVEKTIEEAFVSNLKAKVGRKIMLTKFIEHIA